MPVEFIACCLWNAPGTSAALAAERPSTAAACLPGRIVACHCYGKKKLRAGRGGVGKSVVVGMKDRQTNKVKATPIPDTTKPTLHGFAEENAESGSKKYTDQNPSYSGMENHEAVNHSVGEFVRDMAHTNGIESFWALLKRGDHGTFHQMSTKHLHRYVNEFAGRHNIRDKDTIDQMYDVVRGMIGKRLKYRDLIG